VLPNARVQRRAASRDPCSPRRVTRECVRWKEACDGGVQCGLEGTVEAPLPVACQRHLSGPVPNEERTPTARDGLRIARTQHTHDYSLAIDLELGRLAADWFCGRTDHERSLPAPVSRQSPSKLLRNAFPVPWRGEYLGDANRYMEIFKANSGTLSNPDQIKVGQRLNIPAR